MQVSQAMNKHVEIINQDEVLTKAAKMMRDHDCGSIPVFENDRLVGMITDRDIAVRAVAEGKDPDNEKIKNFMTSGIKYCFESDDLEEAARSMTEQKLRRLPVMNSQKRLVGILSMGDLVTEGDDASLSHETIKSICRAS